MANTGIEVFDRTVQKSLVWIDRTCQEMGRDDRKDSYQAVRAVLGGLRDRLTVEEATDLSAQPPLIIRGIYYEGWKPAGLPVKIRDRDDFLAYIRDKMDRAVADLPPKEALEAVLTVLHGHTTEGEMEDIRKHLPEGLRQLWPAAVPA